MSGFSWKFALFCLCLGLATSLVFSIPAERDANQYEDDYNNDEEEDDLEPEDVIVQITSSGGNFTRNPGENIELPCGVSDPDAVTQWRHEGMPVWLGVTSQNTDESIHRYDNNSLFIKQLELKHAGKWSCQVVQEPPYDYEIVHHLAVNHIPKITSTVPSEKQSVVPSGGPLTLACHATGHPRPQITWKTPESAKNYVKLERDTLTIDKLSGNHTGRYTCLANNSIGQDSATIDITVLYPPIVTVEKETVNSAKEYPAQLACIVDSNPRAQVTWYRGNQQVKGLMHHAKMFEEGNTHYLKISSAKLADFADYTCVASNSKGVSNKTITLTATPGTPKVLKLDTTEDGWTELTWVIESHAPIKEYEIIYKKQEEDGWTSTQPNQGNQLGQDNEYQVMHKFEGLEEGHYHAKLKARNEYGWSSLSQLQLFSGKKVSEEKLVGQKNDIISAKEPLPGNGGMQLRISVWTSLVVVFAYLCH